MSSENTNNTHNTHKAHGHGHTHGHGHGHAELSGKNLLIATVLNVVITIAEIVGGLLSGSLALLSDAIHNLGDTFAVFLAYVANIMSKRSANEKQTFGYKRAEILAALLNAVVLIVIIVFLFIEAWDRFHEPEQIDGLIMFVVATIGLLANLSAVWLLKKDSSKNINIKAAYLHLIGDVISSVAVIIGSIFIYFFEIYWLDPVITVAISLYILKETFSILKESLDILMQAAPKSLDLVEIKKELEKFKDIDNIHHVHAWNLTDSQIHFECHADLAKDFYLSEAVSIRNQMEKLLKTKFGVDHVTIQLEYDCCEGKQLIHKK